jgi:hypothetical protein
VNHGSLWRRHRALSLLVEAWPEIEGEEPPARAVLEALLERANAGWTLASQAEAVEGYEAAVVQGRIPTREHSWHDVFNILAFVTFPHAKAALHRRCLELRRERDGKSPRSREEDALALIDETSLVVAGTAEAIAAFEHARPGRVIAELDHVIRGQGIRTFVLGHALLEHLVLERPPVGAGVVTVALAGAASLEQVDRALAERIAAGGFPRPQMSPTLPWPDPVVESWLAGPD